MDPNVCAALFFSAGAAGMDLSRAGVDNGWILLWLAVRFLTAARAGPETFLQSVFGMLIPLLLLFPFFLFRMLGAGDIKTLAVLGSMFGPQAILSCMFCTFLFGAVLSLFTFLIDGGFRERFRFLTGWFLRCLASGRSVPYLRQGVRWESLHMTIPILMAVLLWAGGWYA